jgi:hypothetical protein
MDISVIKRALESLDSIGRLPTGPTAFTNAVYTIFQVLSVVIAKNGQAGWHTEANAVIGENVLTPDDEPRLQPLVTLLLQIKDAKGDQPLDQLFRKQGGGVDMDKMYAKGVQYIKDLNTKVSDMAGFMGISAIERYYDTKTDFFPFKYNLALIPQLKPFRLDLIPLPFRTIVFLVHSVLELIRLGVSIPSYDMPLLRKLFSVALAGMELLKGDWKTALLSFAGFFGSSLVYIGFVGKILLELFYMISPQLQDDIVMGSFRVTKSILIGFLFNVFKITAIYPVRTAGIKLFESFAARETEIDAMLMEAGFYPRAQIDPKEPIGAGAHGFLEDRAWNCSKEFQDAIAVAKQNTILRFILQLCNIPTSEEDIETQCKQFAKYAHDKGYMKWKDLLEAEGLMTLSKAEDKPPAPPGGADGDAAESHSKYSEQFKQMKTELKALQEQWQKVKKEEKEAHEKLLEALKTVKPTDAAATSSSV